MIELCIIPTYKICDYLNDLIRLVLSRTYSSIELNTTDDGSNKIDVGAIRQLMEQIKKKT